MYLNANSCNETDASKLLSELFRQRTEWETAIPLAVSRLHCTSEKIQAKALWILGEMGLKHPDAIQPHMEQITAKLYSDDDKVREMAIGALGRIGRGRIRNVAPYLDEFFRMAKDPCSEVRMNFICASENIAANSPVVLEHHMDLYATMLYDHAERVRMEAPEIFKVIARKKPGYVEPYIGKLESVATLDSNKLVRTHARNAINATAEKLS